MYLAKNKIYGVGIYLLVNAVVYIRGNKGQLELSLSVLGVILIPILMPRLVAWFASWGFMESLAKDSRSGLPHGFVSFFYWLILIVASMYFLFNWGLY